MAVTKRTTAPVSRIVTREIEETATNLATLADAIEAMTAAHRHLRGRLEEIGAELAAEEKALADAEAAAAKAMADAKRTEADEDKRVLAPLREQAKKAKADLDELLSRLARVKDYVA